MNISLGRALILLVIGTLIVTSIDSLSAIGDPMTKEEAIEISRNSVNVKEGLAMYYSFGIQANYYNSSWVARMKKGYWSDILAEVPEGHSVLEIVWWFKRRGMLETHPAIVLIDAETGIIVYDKWGVVGG